MLFNSLNFALFFPTVCLLYFVLPFRWRTPLLLVASCVFYMAFIPAYILILFVTILIDYVAGIQIERSTGAVRKRWLTGSIISTCAVLCVFKYFHFFTGNFVSAAHLLGWDIPYLDWKIILPIGLSFHTFQSLSYVVEVYRGRQKTERNFVIYATYVMFFPQLVAGPIERPQQLLHQFREWHAFDYERVTSGLKRMAWGFFKKVVVADRLSLYVGDVYAAPRSFNGLQLTIATFFFAYQIYCDFSGYSDIAVGTARVLGFRLMENFNTPYYSKSVSEFWHRWHISLSTWFRDYLYIPMGGNRLPLLGWCGAILVTFGVSGLWHGANWTYVAWGLLNGAYLLIGVATKGARSRFFAALGLGEESAFRTGIRIASTFFLICIGWVIFRARNFADASYVLAHFWRNWDFHVVKTEQFQLKYFPVVAIALVLLTAIEILQSAKPITPRISRQPILARWGIYLAFAFLTVFFGVYRSAQFIYFQF